MKDKTLLISTTDNDQVKISISPDTTFDDAIRLQATLALHILNAYTDVAIKSQSKDIKQNNEVITAIKKQVYYAYNEAASCILEAYAPEFELRPDVTTEAIERVEKEIIEEKYNKLNRKQRRSTSAVVKKAKKELNAMSKM